ncbi:MAG TPA: B12-binding domain-containing protein [Candidatus Aquilonibacter sp.]|nr:B12-binding domain-containing protein [Candidatus Aquilonibacter sp.]
MIPRVELPDAITEQLLAALVSSVELDLPEIFIETVTWAQTMLVFRDRTPGDLSRALEALTFQLRDCIGETDETAARDTLRRAREELSIVRLAEQSFLDESDDNGKVARRYLDALLEGDETRASREVLLAVAKGQKVLDVYERILSPALREVGRLWQRNEITIAHEHLITNATERIIAQVMDLSPARTRRDLCALTVALGDAEHELGARMVADAFTLCGWQASFLGQQVPVHDVVRYIEGISVDVVACSAMMTRDVSAIRDLAEAFESKPVAPVIIVGGAAFDRHPQLWQRIGVDGYAATPLMAVALANELITDCEA